MDAGIFWFWLTVCSACIVGSMIGDGLLRLVCAVIEKLLRRE